MSEFKSVAPAWPAFPFRMNQAGEVWRVDPKKPGGSGQPIDGMSIGELRGKIPGQWDRDGTERDHKKDAKPHRIFPYAWPFELVMHDETMVNWLLYDDTPGRVKSQYGREVPISLHGDSSREWYYCAAGRRAVAFHGPSLRVHLFLRLKH